MTVAETRDIELLTQLNREVQELHVSLHPDLFRPFDRETVSRFFESVMAKDTWHHWVAYDGNLAVGFVQVETRRLANHPFRRDCTILYLHQICVKTTHRTRGVARVLLNCVRSHAKEKGIVRIELDVWLKNEPAIRSFDRLGFRTFKQQMVLEA